MEVGGKKVVKPQKTKSKNFEESDILNFKMKPKKRDKSIKRLLKQEREYVL
jgi:hypothetical protein